MSAVVQDAAQARVTEQDKNPHDADKNGVCSAADWQQSGESTALGSMTIIQPVNQIE